nr:PREDICTED: uncharacterized protein LOC108951674 [Musa acuminata subsp. malaccensis]
MHLRAEIVVVQEYGVELLIEDRRRQCSLEVIKPKVEVLKRWQPKGNIQDQADETIVASVKPVEFETGDVLRDDTTEAIEVNVEEGDVGQEAELHGEVPNDIDIIKVDVDDNVDQGVIRHRNTEDVMITTHIKVDLIADEVVGVRVQCLLPCPQSDITTTKARIGDGDVDLDTKNRSCQGLPSLRGPGDDSAR